MNNFYQSTKVILWYTIEEKFKEKYGRLPNFCAVFSGCEQLNWFYDDSSDNLDYEEEEDTEKAMIWTVLRENGITDTEVIVEVDY